MRNTIFGYGLFVVMLAHVCACTGGANNANEAAGPTTTDSATDEVIDDSEFVASADSFDCFAPESNGDPEASDRWVRVRNFFIKNERGRLGEALEVANGEAEGDYPVGTIVQLIYFEAMAKRGGDFSPESNGWEFFSLAVTDQVTSIVQRGGSEVENFLGGNCFDCHSAAVAGADFICEDTNGCDPIGVGDDFIAELQDSDPRCP